MPDCARARTGGPAVEKSMGFVRCNNASVLSRERYMQNHCFSIHETEALYKHGSYILPHKKFKKTQCVILRDIKPDYVSRERLDYVYF